MSKDEAKLVFKDIYRLYNGDRIFCKIDSRRYKIPFDSLDGVKQKEFL